MAILLEPGISRKHSTYSGSRPNDVSHVPRSEEKERENQYRTLDGRTPHPWRERLGGNGGWQSKAQQATECAASDEQQRCTFLDAPHGERRHTARDRKCCRR